ncbi:hypothetical protein [Rhizobium sp. RU36D]|uniref:hypothetical protein n=1 Tax=Rhizobium sp. RU36D TaxID=1907415 RepID=UPI0009D823A1|nr:hypothetical protein [Rhizobium sp. RU36D]SMC93392.1 hypothetical protein SAMN05880593_1117 [Rhizobium sp. RU36D]
MADSLKALSLAIGLLGSDPSVNAGEWREYVWRTQTIDTCLKTSCPPISLKWDWKRPQTVTVSLTPTMNGLTIRTRLSNDDPLDGDDVCVTLLLRDQAGATIAVFHENRHSDPGTDITGSTTLSLGKKVISAIRSVALGTKQCRGGPQQDDAIYRKARKMLGQR